MENKCDRKKKFCGMCCSHHVGLSFKNHYKKCFNTCENLIRGIRNDKDDDNNKKKKINTKPSQNEKEKDEKKDEKKDDKK